jgi:hypothetical protein
MLPVTTIASAPLAFAVSIADSRRPRESLDRVWIDGECPGRCERTRGEAMWATLKLSSAPPAAPPVPVPVPDAAADAPADDAGWMDTWTDG